MQKRLEVIKASRQYVEKCVSQPHRIKLSKREGVGPREDCSRLGAVDQEQRQREEGSKTFL